MPEERQCRDCGAAMHPIRLIDKAHGGAHTDLEYALPEARRGFWLGRYPVEGRVEASMCDHCGRIVLHGAPTRE